ncbi:sensor histidine kinase [Staphylococcus kloosii]|jgi:two-component system sensor histidine kinase DesK|uniref:histidine kinase n=3 Tax=Staphylococcus kloosii TaxID=29384 RepID=A0ABQ0XHM4_9STAP|nr:sensor histidine kinase [Staphylococcus kloosii]PNZ06399.1 sensor histidine kinase [Staphylococcus kloosii]PTJ74328.1 sensor histidine kinase [Staphylococcus kloosii]GEP80962.1 two-component sensor histidine kinase [Staphylococcus kloosii]SUM49395.1 signal transduction histidine kinase [Staphylococcus kloosii]
MIKRFNVGFLELSSLVYLIFAITPLFTMEINGDYWIYVIIFIIFVISYCTLLFLFTVLSKHWLMLSLLIHYLCIIYFVYNVSPYMSLYFFFSAFALPFLLKVTIKSLAFTLMLLTMISCLIITWFSEYDTALMLFVYYLVILMITISNFKRVETSKLKIKMNEKNAQINMLIAEQERTRIAQDLHDTLGHVFASISLKSELAAKLVTNKPDKAIEEMTAVNRISKDSLNKVRSIINDLKISSFKEEVDTVGYMLREANLTFEFSNAEYAEKLSTTRQSIMAMILREAINNIVKHAQATKIEGQIQLGDKELKLIIKDDGVGVDDVEQLELKSIQERVNILNGTLITYNDEGLCIEVLIPRSVEQ